MGLRFAGRWLGRRPASTLEDIYLAIDTSGHPVYIDWCERHLLVIGESDSGKGSVLANLLVQVEPFAQAGLVRLYGIDLKAMELSMSRAMFQTVAVDVESAAELVTSFRNAMNQRAQDMAGNARAHTPTPNNPRNILVIDELAELFRQDAKVSRQFQHDLTAILGMGRATGNLLWGFSQNPRKDAIPIRDDFNGQMIAMRMGEAEAKMVLPSAALRVGAAPGLSPPLRREQAGCGTLPRRAPSCFARTGLTTRPYRGFPRPPKRSFSEAFGGRAAACGGLAGAVLPPPTFEQNGRDGMPSTARDWMLTISAEKHTQQDVEELLDVLGTYIFQQEEGGKTDYPHFQAFLQLQTPVRMETLKNKFKKAGFNDAHIEMRKGTVQDCVDYCSKEETRVDGPWRGGEIDLKDRQGSRSDLAELRQQIMDGATVSEVLLNDDACKAARYTRYLSELATARDRVKYGRQLRDITVHYLWGDPGVGKTKYIYDNNPIESIYRVTDYRHPWDEYEGQSVLVLDEFDSQFSWDQLLVFLDRYPVMLPARYNNHVACFTTVWIISNEPLSEQYPERTGEKRNALLRRISTNQRMLKGGELQAGELGTEHPEMGLLVKKEITVNTQDDLFKAAKQITEE